MKLEERLSDLQQQVGTSFYLLLSTLSFLQMESKQAKHVNAYKQQIKEDKNLSDVSYKTIKKAHQKQVRSDQRSQKIFILSSIRLKK